MTLQASNPVPGVFLKISGIQKHLKFETLEIYAIQRS